MPPKPRKSEGLRTTFTTNDSAGGIDAPKMPVSPQDHQVVPATSVRPDSANDHATTSRSASIAQLSAQAQSSKPIATDPSAKEDRNSVWVGLSAALQGLKISSSAIPPLSPLVSSLSECVGAISDEDRRHQGYCQLASDLTAELNSLGHHLMQSNSTRMSQAVQNLVNAIERQVEHIASRQRRRSFVRYVRYADAARWEEHTIECYRQIEVYFQQLQVDAMMSMWSNTNEQLAIMGLNYLTPAMQARYNSAQARVVRRQTCTPGTRTSIRKELRDWANNPNSPKVYWLNGMAGTGKTTIACSFCDELEKSYQLGASFFCSRLLPECRAMSRLVPTIAYQLASFSSAFRSALCDILSGNHDLSSYNLDTQLTRLVRDPLLTVKDGMPTNVVIVVDALDELSNDDDARIFLDTLFCHAADLPVRFLVTSRPEHSIRDRMLSRDDQSRAILHLHDIERSFVQADIEIYLQGELQTISPSHDQVQQLAKQAGSLFIYAATAVRYIIPGSHSVDHHRRLKVVLQVSSDSADMKYKDIDALYKAILAGALDNTVLEPEETDDIRLVLCAAVCVKEPLNVKAMASLLGLENESRALSVLQPLRSVLHVSESTGMVSTLHASFPDFMLDASRSGTFHFNEALINEVLAQRCFETMETMLRFNICHLESSYVFDEDVPNLDERVSQVVPPELLYACRHWGSHLAKTNASRVLCDLSDQFLSNRLFFWMEVLNLKRCIGTGEAILYEGQKWLEECGASSSTLNLVKDAREFVTYFAANPISRSTPHLYISALPVWKKESAVSMEYWNKTRGLAHIDARAIGGSASALVAAWTNEAPVLSVAFSPSGNQILSGSQDGTIRVWDSQSGDVVSGPFEGHTGAVSTVSFSPDGSRIASGSRDRTIRLWNVDHGTPLLHPFEGHTGSVLSAAFSQDGVHVVSGSDDRTIRIWDSHTGVQVTGPFKGHTGSVRSVAFSPDGARIVSGSWDKTIRVWDARTGAAMTGPFVGHARLVSSVAFSPNGVSVVSGSDDRTIRVWDAYTGRMVSGPIEGHTDAVSCVAFSPDGAQILSGSRDMTIRVWDAQTGVLTSGPFEGHAGWVRGAAFSPDGTRIVSCSNDRTIRVWDAQIGVAELDSFEGHTQPVLSVAFSADGTCVVSCSDDGTFCVWDARSGLLRSGPFKGNDRSTKLAIVSADGTRVAQLSLWEGTLTIWDAKTGAKLSGPFRARSGLTSSVVFSSDGTRIASSSSGPTIANATISVWDSQTGSVISTWSTQFIYCLALLAFSQGGARLAFASRGHTVRICDTQTGGTLSDPFIGHTDRVYAATFSPDGSLLASGSADATVRVWDARAGSLVCGPLKGHTAAVRALAFSHDGNRVASGSDDTTIRIWNARTGALMFGPFEGHTGPALSVALSPDGACVASGSHDAAIRIWDTKITDSPTVHDWRMDSNGWIITRRNSKRLLWIPLELRNGLHWPQNMAVVCAERTLKLDLGTLHGTNWHECYVGSSQKVLATDSDVLHKSISPIITPSAQVSKIYDKDELKRANEPERALSQQHFHQIDNPGRIQELSTNLSRFLAHGAAADVWLSNQANTPFKCVSKTMRVDRQLLEQIDQDENDTSPSDALDLWRTLLKDFHKKVTEWLPLSHHNVVSVLGYDDPLTLRVEYCPNGCLRNYLKHLPKNDNIKKRMIEDTARGMLYLHRHDPPIVHGNLNAGKLFVDENGGVKVGEFSLAALTENFAGIIPSISYVGLRWTSPELVKLDPTKSSLTPTLASDVWALGCTIFEIAAEELPYAKHKHEVRLRRAIASKELPSSASRFSNLDSVQMIVEWCWSQLPEERPNMSQIAKVLLE